jgi:hypothetical protein
MSPVRGLSPPKGGWRGQNPAVVTQVAQLFKAARLIEGDTPKGRKLLAAWRRSDALVAYARLVAELEPGEADFAEAFRNLGERT